MDVRLHVDRPLTKNFGPKFSLDPQRRTTSGVKLNVEGAPVYRRKVLPTGYAEYRIGLE